MAKNSYDAEAIEVLSGLDPVKKRPGMYTDTSNPNHLIQEVLDNSVDEALSGYCSNIKIAVLKDGNIRVSDDGRGMPVDIHPEHKVSGVELILCKLHAGAKFSNVSVNTVAISAASDNYEVTSPAAPCGNCRQAMYEYEFKQKQPIRLLLMGEKGSIIECSSVDDILPLGFNSSFL